MPCKSKCTEHEYELPGPHVEPSSGLWGMCAKLRMVSTKELTRLTDNPNDGHYFPPYPLDQETIRKEIRELQELEAHRDDPCFFSRDTECPPSPALCDFPKKKLPQAYGCRRPTSKLWNLNPYPLGGVLVNRFPGEDVIRTGRGLARAIENETPGLYHRHALNFLVRTRNWSPPRQALVWAALDIAIASALQAAWYYKWVANGRDGQDNGHGCTGYRERPKEYTDRNGIKFEVLFDRPDEFNPVPLRCPDALNGAPTPGTPRHPAYPSGHSTYTAAATEILKAFFGNDLVPEFLGGDGVATIGTELDNLADNIGVGRMWAGVHWRSDHEAGQRLGRTVACLVLKQLASMRAVDDKGDVVPFNLFPREPVMPCDKCDPKQTVDPCKNTPPPDRAKLCAAGEKIANECTNGDITDDGNAPTKPAQRPPECKGSKRHTAVTHQIDAYRGPQQGGGNP
jgi:membrane-associated phospholipid phosphatase